MRRHHLLALLVLAGCSFAAARGPSSVGPAQCTRGYWLPAGDALVLAPTLAFVTFASAYACSEGGQGTKCDLVPPAFLLGTIATLASSIYGVVTVNRCRATPEPEEPLPPPPPPVDPGCAPRRAELQRAALAEPDLTKRTRMLQALPTC